jgi:site-specific DNA-adenine methylase
MTDILRPFFSFYGSKWRIAHRYPQPLRDVPIIEPFAGSAGYSLRHPKANVILYDADERIAGIWSYLITTRAEEIRRLPLLEPGESINDKMIPQEARWLIGYWLNKGSASPSITLSAWARNPQYASQFWGELIRERIASQVDRIRHWTIRHATYIDLLNRRATWFIDPPYSGRAGSHYRLHEIDYTHLSTWCKDRKGLVITCENDGANWLPFQRLVAAKANRKSGTEGVSFESVSIQDDREVL